MSCGCPPSPCCTPAQLCAPENFGLLFPSLVGPMGPPGGAGTFVDDFDALRALDPTSFVAGYIAYVAGHSAINDGGGGLFEYDPASVSSDNDGTIVEPTVGPGAWLRIYSGEINVQWFGAPGDSTGQTVPIQNAVNATPAGGSLYFPAATGSYTCGAITYSSVNGKITLRGDGWQNTNNDVFGSGSWNSGVRGSLIRSTAAAGSAFSFTSAVACNLNGIAIVGPGAGTAIGVSMVGSSVEGVWTNVLIANFLQGFDFNNILESQFNTVVVRGCDTGGKLSNASNNNIFINCEFQKTTVKGLWVLDSALTVIKGGLWQHYTGIGISLTGTGRSLHVNGAWFEAQNDTTDAIKIESGDFSSIINCWFSGGATNRDRIYDAGSFTRLAGNRAGSVAGGGGTYYGAPVGGKVSDAGIAIDLTVTTGYTVERTINGSPEGDAQYAYPRGSIITQLDGTNGQVSWVKTTTGGTATGWTNIGMTNIVGTATNDAAVAGRLGEELVGTGAAAALVTDVAKTITSIVLTPGDWEVEGSLYYIFGVGTTSGYQHSSLSNTTNTASFNEEEFSITAFTSGAATPGSIVGGFVGKMKRSVAANTTIYLVALASLAVAGMTSYGRIRARRVR